MADFSTWTEMMLPPLIYSQGFILGSRTVSQSLTAWI